MNDGRMNRQAEGERARALAKGLRSRQEPIFLFAFLFVWVRWVKIKKRSKNKKQIQKTYVIVWIDHPSFVQNSTNTGNLFFLAIFLEPQISEVLFTSSAGAFTGAGLSCLR